MSAVRYDLEDLAPRQLSSPGEFGAKSVFFVSFAIKRKKKEGHHEVHILRSNSPAGRVFNRTGISGSL